MFKTGHALPLAVTRIPRPRMSRGGSPECPRESGHSWTWQRPVRGLDSAENRTRTRIFLDRAQSVLAFSLRQQTWPRTITVRAQATALIVRRHEAASDAKCPQTVRRLDLSATSNQPHPQSVRKLELATDAPHRCITVSIAPPVRFPIHVQIFPPHVLV